MAGEVTRRGSRSDMEHKLAKGLLIGVDGWARLVTQRAQENAPVDEGRLYRSIHYETPEEIERLIVSSLVGTNVEYAAAHELGSGIHASDPAARELIKIEAGFWTGKSDKKSLAFEWPDGPKDHPAYDPESGKFLFRVVYHPGVPAQPYLRPALHETAEEGRRLVFESVRAQLRIGR